MIGAVDCQIPGGAGAASAYGSDGDADGGSNGGDRDGARDCGCGGGVGSCARGDVSSGRTPDNGVGDGGGGDVPSVGSGAWFGRGHRLADSSMIAPEMLKQIERA